MRLKSLKLAGFKSFAHPTTFKFHHNITAIVGPNGCGKSNVIDAIRWVLGETSAKQLRGGAMSDVIFAGTQNHAAKSMASVELTFEHTQDETTGIRHELNLYHELSIRRQVNKDGKSDYFINGTKARRRDVVDIFLGTGLGSRSYAVIEQGMIGRIVDSSPKQLREFIEEAAGVSRYQVRREETHKKLQKAQENLDRLNDLQSELEKQHKTLSRQAQAAQKYHAIKDEMNQIEAQLAIAQLYASKQTEQTLAKRHQTLSQQAKQQQETLTELTKKIDKLSERIAEQQWLKDDKRDFLHQQQMQAQQTEHQHQALLDKKNQLIHDIEQQQQRQQDLAHTLDKLSNERQQKQQQLDNFVPIQSQHQQRISQLQNELAPLAQAWQNIEQAYEQKQHQFNEIDKQLAVNKQALEQLTHAMNKWQRQHDQWQQAWQKLTNHDSPKTLLVLLDEKIDEQHTRISHYERQLESLQTEYEQAQHHHQQHTQQLTQQHQSLIALEKRHATLASEYDTLHSLLHRKSDTQADTTKQNDINPNNINPLCLGQPLNQTIELTELGLQHADGLDKWLALWLDALVLNLPNLLSKQAIISDKTNSDKTDNYKTNNGKHHQPKTDLQLLTKLITHAHPDNQISAMLNGYSPTPIQSDTHLSKLIATLRDEHQLSLWAFDELIKTPVLTALSDAYYCPISHIATANSPQEHNKLNALVTLLKYSLSSSQPMTLCTDTGWFIGRFGIIHLSKLGQGSDDSHFLKERHTQRQRLAKLEDLLSEIETTIDMQAHAYKQQQSRHENEQITLEEQATQLANLKTTHLQAKNDLMTWQHEQQRLKADHNRLSQEKIQLDKDFTEHQHHQTQLDSNSIELNEQQQQLQTDLNRLDKQRYQLQIQKDKIHATLNELKQAEQQSALEKQQLLIQLEHLNQQSKQIIAQDQQTNKRIDNQQTQLDTLSQQLPSLDDTIKQQQKDIAHSQIELEEYQNQLTQLQLQLQTLKTAIHTAQQQQNDSNTQLAACTTELAIAKERLNDAKIRVDEHSNNLGTGVSASSLLADFIAHNRKIHDTDNHAKQQKLQQTYQSLQIQLGRLGAVNMAAKAELDAINERLAPLTEQTNDILASIDKLNDAIITIDDKTKSLFLQTLKVVNDDLNSLFAKVFGGGQASLSLINEEGLGKADSWRAGVQLMAQPKGKRNSRLAVLSGGEKTLTALSLIFAIFKQHPAPFCVLDEVDAPLDDANVARFTSLINELANEVQFIFISHNKLSMQIADELKGITMPNAGISTLVSVNLDEAERYIE